MPVSVFPYSVSELNKLPTLEEANAKLQELNGKTIVLDGLIPILTKHDVHGLFRFNLTHKHHEIQAGEKLVHYGSTATIWTDITPESGSKDIKLTPKSWKVSNAGGLTPHNWSLDETIDVNSEKYQAVLQEIISAIQKSGSIDCVGLTIPHFTENSLELTMGNSDITFPLTSENEDSHDISTAWAKSVGHDNARDSEKTDAGTSGIPGIIVLRCRGGRPPSPPPPPPNTPTK